MQYFVNFFQLFLLVMVRMLGLFMTAPLFSSGVVAGRIRTIAAFITTALVFPLVTSLDVEVPTQLVPYVLSIANEAMLGVFMGFAITMVFSIFQMAARFFSIQAGFGITETVDPLAQVSVPVIGQFQNLAAMLVFISLRGPYLLIDALYKSYKEIPVLSEASAKVFTESVPVMIEHLIQFSSSMFIISLQIAFPMMATLFLLSISLGLLAKAAPQMNILILGFPFQVGLAVITFYLVSPMLVQAFVNILESSIVELNRVIVALGAA